MSRLTDHRGERCSGRCVIRSRLVGARERAVAPTTVADQGRQASPHPALRSRQLPIQVAEPIHDRVRAGATREAKFEIRSLTPFLVNIYPVMVQRFNRARIARILQRGSGLRPSAQGTGPRI